MFAGGLAVSIPLHAIGFSAGLLIGAALGFGSGDGPWPERTQYAFVISFGAWQWCYLAPAIILLRRQRAVAMSWGLVVSGLLFMAFSALALLVHLWNMPGFR